MRGGQTVIGLLLVLGWLGIAPRVAAQSADEVAAAFLFNFAKYVAWPAQAFKSDDAPVTIGFVGKASLADTFEQNSKGKNANGRDLVDKRLTSGLGAEACNILFIGDARQAVGVLGAVKAKPILTVGEGDAFLGAGGMIALSKEGSRLVFDVNNRALKAAALKPDIKIEQAARSVK